MITNLENTLLKKTTKMLDEPKGYINFVDIDYQIIEDPDHPYTTKTRKVIERNYEAIINPYRMWLQSKRNDYIRAPKFGGLFQFALNDRVQFLPENEGLVKQIIMDESAEKFPEIPVVGCDVKCLLAEKSWQIDIIVQDIYTKNVIPVSVNIEGEKDEDLNNNYDL
jgi:hypothetical protein